MDALCRSCRHGRQYRISAIFSHGMQTGGSVVFGWEATLGGSGSSMTLFEPEVPHVISGRSSQ